MGFSWAPLWDKSDSLYVRARYFTVLWRAQAGHYARTAIVTYASV